MLKKIAIISFALLLVFTIIFVALIPLATADMMNMADDYDLKFSVDNELLSLSAEGVKSVKLTGDWISDLEVCASNDENIHIVTDGYRIRKIEKITPTIDENGVMLVDIKMDNSKRPSINFTDFFRAALAEMNGSSHNYIRLELPSDIEFITGSHDNHNYGNLDIENDVLVIGDPYSCPICGNAFCDNPDCEEEWLERQAEREEERLEREAERLERAAERAEERAEHAAERIENSAARFGTRHHHSGDNTLCATKLVIV